jgi:hypothetical protein
MNPQITPSISSVCVGTSLTLNSASHNGASYAWNPSGGTWTPDSTNSNSLITTPSVDGSFTYSLNITNIALGCSLAEAVNLTVNPLPTITAVTNTAICSGSATNIDWTSATAVSQTWNFTGAGIAVSGADSGSTKPIVQYLTGNNVDVLTGTYLVEVMDSNGCTATTSIIQTVNPKPTVIYPSSDTICSGSNYPIQLSTSTAYLPDLLSWDPPVVQSGISGHTSNTMIPAVFADVLANSSNSIASASYIFTPVSDLGCIGDTSWRKIKVKPASTVIVSGGNQTICDDTLSGAISFSSSVVGTNNSDFQWTNSNPLIGLDSSGTGNINAFTATNISSDPIVGTISVTSAANSCPGAVSTFTITVNPTPRVDSIVNFTYCNNTSIQTIVFNGPTSSTTFSWTNNNSNIGIGGSGSGNITFITNNSSNSLISSAVFTVTPSANSCSGPQRTFTISVLPTPKINSAMILTDSICSGTNKPVSLISSLDASTNLVPQYKITRGFNNANLTSAFTYPQNFSSVDSIIGYEIINNSSNSVTGFANYTIETRIPNGTNFCLGVDTFFLRGINPIPTLSNLTDTAICTGKLVIKDFNPLVSTPSTFNWGVSNIDSALTFTNNTVTNNSVLNQTVNSSIDDLTQVLSDTVLITSIIGNCSSKDTFNVTVHPNPTITTTQSDFLTQFCSGDTMKVQLKSSILPVESSLFTWVHTNPNNVIINATDSNGTVIDDKLTNLSSSNQTSLQYVVKVMSQKGCQDALYSETFTQLVNPIPRLTVTDFTICDNSVFVFDARKEMTDSAFAGVYANWSFVDSALANDKFRIFNGGTTIATPKTGTNAISHEYRRKVGTNTPDIIEYSFVLISDSGCVNSTTDTVQGDRLFLRINPTPLDFTIVSEDLPTGGYCGSSQHRMFGIIGDTVSKKKFVWSHIPGAPKSVYTIDSLPKALIKTENGDTIRVIANYSGFNCFHTEILIDDFTKNDNPIVPKVVFKSNYVNNSEILVCLFNKVKNADGYQWGRTDKKTLVDEVLSGQRAQEYRMQSGDDTTTFFYWVEIIQEDQTCYQRIYLSDPLLGGKSTEEEIINNEEANFVVYPNPTNNIVQVDITNADFYDVFQADVYNMYGVKVMTRTIRNLRDAFSVSHMVSGTYVIKITNNGALIGTQKFIKQ